jgi:SAM-dependent methyltransferase
MLRSLTSKLICPTCEDDQSVLIPHEFIRGESDHISTGILRCGGCGTWYPIENDVLEFVPPALAYANSVACFGTRFASQLAALGCEFPEQHSNSADQTRHEFHNADQLKQRKHFDEYAEQSNPHFPDYTLFPIWRAASDRFLRIWRSALSKPGAWILDVGCGTGIHSFPLADQYTIIGLDISKKAVGRATEDARRHGLMAATTFFVGDATLLPFKDGAFDYAQTVGSLHHLPDPRQRVRDILRILVARGIYFGVENNKSMFRWIFDLMMKIRPLWVELAGAEPLMSHRMIETWVAGLNARLTSQTSVFLPPHLLNLLEPVAAARLLEVSDQLCSFIPGLRNHGGQILFEIQKLD